MFLVDNLWKVLHLKHFISKEDIIYQSLESKPRFSCLIFSKGASFIAFALWYIFERQWWISLVKLRKNTYSSKFWSEFKFLLRELLIGRAANFPKITVELFQSRMNHRKSCTNKFLRHLKKLLNKTKRLAKTEYVQIPMFGGSCFLTLA